MTLGGQGKELLASTHFCGEKVETLVVLVVQVVSVEPVPDLLETLRHAIEYTFQMPDSTELARPVHA